MMDLQQIPPQSFLVISGFGLLAAVFFTVQTEWIFGFVFLIVSILGIGLYFGIGGRKETLRDLFRKKRELIASISEAEKRFLSRGLDENAYRDLVNRKQTELVEIEARIDLQSGIQNAAHAEELQQITSKNRHLLKDLLDRKAGLVEEMHLSEQKYFNRQLEETLFFELRGQQQAKLLELENDIEKIESEEAAQRVLEELKQKLKDLDETALEKKKKNEEEMADDISDQFEP